MTRSGQESSSGRRAERWALGEIMRRPSWFAARVLARFRENQGLLLGGAVAYYAILSLVPLVALIWLLLSRIFDQRLLLRVLSDSLEFIAPRHAADLVEGARSFFLFPGPMGLVLFLSLIFFSSLAFTALENAMAVIFLHRRPKRRHFLVSAILPYLFIVLLTTGLIVVTVVSGLIEAAGSHSLHLLGHEYSLNRVTVFLLYMTGVGGEVLLLSALYLVMPVGQLSLRHALVGGFAATVLWEITRHVLYLYYSTVSQIQLVYGSFATSVGVLLSAELGATVLLIGGQIIAEFELLCRERRAQ